MNPATTEALLDLPLTLDEAELLAFSLVCLQRYRAGQPGSRELRTIAERLRQRLEAVERMDDNQPTRTDDA